MGPKGILARLPVQYACQDWLVCVYSGSLCCSGSQFCRQRLLEACICLSVLVLLSKSRAGPLPAAVSDRFQPTGGPIVVMLRFAALGNCLTWATGTARLGRGKASACLQASSYVLAASHT